MVFLDVTRRLSTGASSLLFLCRSPASDPRHIASECTTKIDGGIINRKLVDLGPELDLVSLALALMAVVPSGARIHRERSAAAGFGLVHGTRSTPLVSGPTGWFEVDQVQDLLHRDLVAKLVEVDSGHGRLCFRGGFGGRRTVPFPLIYGERGTILFGSVDA